MAITTLAGVESGLTVPFFLAKTPGSQANGTNQWLTAFYEVGFPAAAAAPSPGMTGEALTSYAGQFPFTNPASGNTYLVAVRTGPNLSTGNISQRTVLIVDRLWHNSGFDVTSTSAQTVNSVAWPARDVNGSTNGEGVYLAVEVSSATGSGTPTITVEYTNSANTGTRTGTSILAVRSSAPSGHWFPIGLDAGDIGVRSVQSLTLSATMTSGTIHLVAYRPIAMLNSTAAPNINAVEDALTLAMPRLWDNSVLQTVGSMVNNGSRDGGSLLIQYAQG